MQSGIAEPIGEGRVHPLFNQELDNIGMAFGRGGVQGRVAHTLLDLD